MSNKHLIFIDGSEGTTGLQLRTRLEARDDIELISIPEELRKDPAARAERMNRAEVVFLCLPDAAAIEAEKLVTNPETVVIDTSTAHRVSPGWAYGFAELSPAHRQAIAQSKRIANPGCYATGFIAAAYPLVKLGIAAGDYPFSCHAVSGYSGAGKKGIAQYEAADRPQALDSPRQYALGLAHKHLPEMQMIPGLAEPPLFNPMVCDYYCGMAVSVPLHTRLLQKRETPDSLRAVLAEYYKDQPLIEVREAPADGFLPGNLLANDSRLALYVCGNERQMTVISVLDNLGKGASGAAVQNMNLVLGADPCKSLL